MALNSQEIRDILVSKSGLSHVYYQPPEGLKMVYPCIIFEKSNRTTKFADNNPYKLAKRYTVTVIDRDPDSLVPDKISTIPTCVTDRIFVTDNLYHEVFSIFF